MPPVIPHRTAVSQDKVDAPGAIERTASAERDDRIHALRRGENASRLDQFGVRVLEEFMKREGLDAGSLQQLDRFVDVAAGVHSEIRDEQRAVKAELARKFAKVVKRAQSEDQARPSV